jgi:hypothetical protein
VCSRRSRTVRTAGEIAAATGIPRVIASMTLSKLAKSGEVVKAERGYGLPEPPSDIPR